MVTHLTEIALRVVSVFIWPSYFLMHYILYDGPFFVIIVTVVLQVVDLIEYGAARHLLG